MKPVTALRETTDATVTSKAAAKPTQRSKDIAERANQSNRRTSGRPKVTDPVLTSKSAHNLRPRPGPKVSAEPTQCPVQVAERSVPRHRTKRQRGKTDDPRKASTIGRGSRNKDSSEPVTEQIVAPVDNAEKRHATEAPFEPIDEDHDASGSRQLLTEEALEELNRRLESIDPANRDHSGAESENGSSQSGDIDPHGRFNRKWGYVPPLDEETIRIIEAIIKNPACAETMVGISPVNQEFLPGLHNRNVLSEPSTDPDPREEEIKSLSLEGFLPETREQETSHEELWKLDKAKCTPASSEALYQRTLMISLIARHVLIYQSDSSKEQIFDFSVEEPWGCLPMPTRLVWVISKGHDSGARFLTQPKPDLAVCFKRSAVISERTWNTLPEPTKGLACFENRFSNASRVFHFLTVETKKAMLDFDSPQALHQCLNNASQALHNMYEFFRDAGPEHEQVFYDKVRFFSVVANRNGIVVRIHRAIRKPDDASAMELVMPDRPDYRLEFEFRDFQRIGGGGEFSRERVLQVVKKILKYAKDDLLKLVKAAALKLGQKLEKDLDLYLARHEVDFYSYGQPNPKDYRSSRHTGIIPPTIANSVQRQLRSARLSSKCAPSDRLIANGQTTPKTTPPPNHLVAARNQPKETKNGRDRIR